MRFAHVLFRDTLYDGLTSARRMRLHGQGGGPRATTGRPDAARLAELARHATAAGEHAEALRSARAAAGLALDAHAYEEAARLFGLALEALDRRPAAGDRPDRIALLMAAGDALAAAGSPRRRWIASWPRRSWPERRAGAGPRARGARLRRPGGLAARSGRPAARPAAGGGAGGDRRDRRGAACRLLARLRGGAARPASLSRGRR